MGEELVIVNNELYCGKILIFKKGCKFSMHFHMIKDETWYVEEGKFIYRYIDTAVGDIIEKELKPLKLELAKFKTEITRVQESKFGCDHVYFTTEINPGSGFKPLNKIASGGELSRFLLAAKLCLFGEDNKKTQIFDEIDRGVGGATASAIGKRLLELSKHEQVLVVTHSPQVAAYSDNHLKVEKINSDKSTITKVATLNEEKTVREIARMLSGELVTSEALAAAAKLRNSSRGIS